MRHLTRRVRQAATLAAAVVALVVFVGPRIPGLSTVDWPDLGRAPTPPSGQGAADWSQAANLARSLTVKGRAPKTGYDSDEFGSGWASSGGCDTRNRILARDLDQVTYRPGTHDCEVQTGVLHDPYTGKDVVFDRLIDPAAVQIDHLVARGDAWQKGAQQWDEATRRAFANDPANLYATAGPVNAAKGDGDAATWLPPNKPFRCTYVAGQVDVKTRYGLWVTAAEQDAMVRMLDRCAEGGGA